MTPKKRGRGRPRITAPETKRNNFTLRMRAGMREWLRAEAEASGRSMSEHVEWILNEHHRNMQRLPFEMGVIASLASLKTAILRQRWPEKL